MLKVATSAPKCAYLSTEECYSVAVLLNALLQKLIFLPYMFVGTVWMKCLLVQKCQKKKAQFHEILSCVM